MNTIKRNYSLNSPAGALVYPLDMKFNGDNGITLGQDRIEFSLYEYAKKLNSLTTPNTNPSTTPNAQNIVFPNVTERRKEKEEYKLIAINLGDPIGPINRIYLPIQDKIQDQNGVEWGSGELNEFQRMLANLSYNIMSSKGDIGESSINAAEQLLKNPDFGNLVRLYLVGEAISVQNLLTRATGNILNPNLELLFSKPTLRPFSFNFKLSARSKKEAEIVKGIIKFFKKGMASRLKNKSTLFVQSPLVFGIRYLQGSQKTHPGINLIKKCALTNCVVDYTPNSSYSTYEDGSMTSYTLNLTLQELLPIYNVDYDETDEDINKHPIGY